MLQIGVDRKHRPVAPAEGIVEPDLQGRAFTAVVLERDESYALFLQDFSAAVSRAVIDKKEVFIADESPEPRDKFHQVARGVVSRDQHQG